MDVLFEKLDAKSREWHMNIAAEIREQIFEIIYFTDEDLLDIM